MYLLPIIFYISLKVCCLTLCSRALITFLIQYLKQALKCITFFQWQIYITNKNGGYCHENVLLLKSEGNTSKCCSWFTSCAVPSKVNLVLITWLHEITTKYILFNLPLIWCLYQQGDIISQCLPRCFQQ